eukprot:GAHX01000027.1.p1 GENE.GAHX01000027.1~~GAHX01000027.1.p1  ORF type:complete len:420 (+),score=93.57 GAHX01000027.1:30-1289(+)
MAKKLYTPLNPDDPEEEFTFKLKSDKEAGSNKTFFSKVKTYLRKPKTKTQSVPESQTTEFNTKLAGGFDLTPMPQHHRGASFFVGVNKNAPLNQDTTAHQSRPARGSIVNAPVQCALPSCTNKISNFVTRRCTMHSHASEKSDIVDEDDTLSSMENAIVRLYKTWNYNVEEESEDNTIITWNFIWEDVHYQTLLFHVPEDTLAPEICPGSVKMTLNGVEIFNKKLEVNSDSEKLRFTVSPEDCSFTLDYTIEPISYDAYGFVYSFYVNRSPFEKCRLRWVRDKLKKQLENNMNNIVKINTHEMTGWKHFTAPIPDRGKDAIKSIYNFSVEGREHEAVVEVDKKKLTVFIDKNQIDVKEKTHCMKRGPKLIVRKPKKIRFFANFKECQISIKRNENNEREIELIIDGVPFYVFQWIINNL